MIRLIDIVYLDELPMRPLVAEFGITVDFTRDRSDPVKIFESLASMLSAASEMDRVLIGAVLPDAEPTTVIEDVEASSITTWVKSKIQKVDDQALKEFDIKQQVGACAVKAKYRIIQFLDEREKSEKAERIKTLRRDLEELASDAAQEGLLPPVIDMKALSSPMNTFQGAKSRLSENEKVTIKSDYQEEYRIDIESQEPISHDSETPESATESSGIMEMVLLIRKADLLGKAQWEFRHGAATVHANIEDQNWLDRFHRGEERIIPGTYMRANVSFHYEYNAKGELIRGRYEVSEVLDMILPTPDDRRSLFNPDAAPKS